MFWLLLGSPSIGELEVDNRAQSAGLFSINSSNLNLITTGKFLLHKVSAMQKENSSVYLFI